MKSYDQYFKLIGRASDRLLEIVNEDQGWGLTTGQASSIVNTSEALYVIKAHGKLLTSSQKETVFAAQNYLAQNAPVHVKPRKDGGRGDNVRYVSFSLMGLLQFPEFLSEDLLKAIRWCIAWLDQNRRDDGWPETATTTDTSLGQTAIIVSALCSASRTLPPYALSGCQNINELIEHGLRSIGRHRRRDGWWPARTFATTEGSPTKTGLAINALIDARSALLDENYVLEIGGANSTTPVKLNVDTVIKESVLQLEQSYPRWISHMEDDREVPGTDWKDPAYAVATWACVNGGIEPRSSEAIIKALERMWLLWSDRDCLWSDAPRAKGSLRSTFHTVRALTSVQARIEGRSFVPEISGQRELVGHLLFDGKSLTCQLPTGRARIELGDRAKDVLVLLIRHQHEEISAQDISLKLRIPQGNVSKYIYRLNKKVKEGSGGYVNPLVDVTRGRRSKYALHYKVQEV